VKVFISWSGDSKGVAGALYHALPRLFDDAEPWISTATRAGTVWIQEVHRQLNDTDFGIVCVTKSNQKGEWLNFEAGALSRNVEGMRELMPIFLIDIDETSEVAGPMSAFQMSHATEADFLNIIKSLNSKKNGIRISEDILEEKVRAVWPKINKEILKVRESPESEAVEPIGDSDLIKEILDTVRSLATNTEDPSTSAMVRASALSDGITNRILRQLDTQTDPGTMSWTRFDQIIKRLAQTLHHEYSPDFVVGVYPEGGFVGYLLWQDAGRKWPILVAPDVDTEPLEVELDALGAKIHQWCVGRPNPRGLIVDLLIKSGNTLTRTLDLVKNACRSRSLDVELRTLCLVQLPHATPKIKADFVGVQRTLQFPFESDA
jgi:hypothetical protein